MNKLELIIYNFVKDNPRLKQKIVDLYQGLMGLIPQKSLKTTYPVVERQGYFYGFHDKCPFSNNGKFLLAHKVTQPYKKLNEGDKITVGYFKNENWEDFKPLGETSGWNWQLGSMLQWFGNNNEKIIYNIVNGNIHSSKVVNLEGEVIQEFDYPVVHVSEDGKYFSSYNFHRAEKAMPGYGLIFDSPVLNNMDSDYFRVLSTETGKEVYKISLSEAASIKPHESMKGAFHYFHHSLFNPSSNRLFFLHRWVDKNGRRWTRMFSVDVTGENLFLFPMDEMVSHITWASDDEIFAYLRMPNEGDGYFLVQDKTGEYTRYFEEVLNSDGHPTMDKNRDIVITDTYPDRFRNQYLVLLNTKNQSRINLCRTHLPAKFKRYLQVDLHPRLHPTLQIACADSARLNKHSLITLDFS